MTRIRFHTVKLGTVARQLNISSNDEVRKLLGGTLTVSELTELKVLIGKLSRLEFYESNSNVKNRSRYYYKIKDDIR